MWHLIVSVPDHCLAFFFEPDNWPVHFRSSRVFISNLAGLKYDNNVHNRLFASFALSLDSHLQIFGLTHLGSRIQKLCSALEA